MNPEGSSMHGRTVLITGATNGIGLAASRQLAEKGADLIIAARSRERGENVAADLRRSGAPSVDLVTADFASMEEVRRLATEVTNRHPRLHVLLNNAGAVYSHREVTVDGFEMTFAVNHLAPFLLTNLLLPLLLSSAPARVVTVASDAAKGARINFEDIGGEQNYGSFRAYGQSKLANILFAYELARRTEGSGVTSNCCHPGMVATGFNKNNGALMKIGMTLVRPFQKSANRGAETPVYLASSPEVEKQTGRYYVDCKDTRSPEASYDLETARRLWELSAQMTGLVESY